MVWWRRRKPGGGDRYDRANRVVDDLLRDRRPKPYPVDDEEEREVLQMAAALRPLEPGADLPRPGFVAALRGRLALVFRPARAPSRRPLVLAIGAGAVAGVVLGLVAGLETVARPWAVLVGTRAVANQKPWVAVGRAREVPARDALAFMAGGVRGYVVRDGAQLLAVSAICNHWHCQVDWTTETGVFVCRCDLARFRRAGESLEDPQEYGGPLLPLTRLPLRMDGGTVYVQPA